MKLETNIWLSTDGLFCGTKEDYSQNEWEQNANAGYIFVAGTDVKYVYAAAAKYGFSKNEIDELLGIES